MMDTPDSGTAAMVQETVYAGTWRRLAAFVLDVIIIVVLVLTVWWRLWSSEWAFYFSLFVLIWFYNTGLESSPLQATFGKIAVGLRVVDTEGARISFARANARFFTKLLILPLLIPLVVFAIPRNTRKQGPHDFIAKTCVIRPPASAWINRVHVLLACVALIIPLVLIFLIFRPGGALFRVQMAAESSRGKVLFYSVVPTGEEMPDKVYTTSTDYFNACLKVTYTYPEELTPERNMWAVLVNVQEDADDRLPLLVTRNVDIDALNRALKTGITSNDFSTRVELSPKTPFNTKGFVVVCKGGVVLSYIGKNHCTLGTIFGNTEIPPSPEGEAPLMYLKP